MGEVIDVLREIRDAIKDNNENIKEIKEEIKGLRQDIKDLGDDNKTNLINVMDKLDIIIGEGCYNSITDICHKLDSLG